MMTPKIQSLLSEHQSLTDQIQEYERRIRDLKEQAALIRGKLYVEQEREKSLAGRREVSIHA